MNLLDQFSNMSPDKTQGLLAAASQILQKSGPSLTPTSFGQIMGSGLQAYQGSMDASRKRNMEEEQQAQLAQLRDLQIQEGTGTLADQTRARQQAEALRKFYMQQANGGAPAVDAGPAGVPQQQMASAMPGGDNSPKIGGPGWLQAYQADQGGAMPTAPASAIPAPSAPPMGQSDPYSRQMALAEQLRKGGFYNEADAKEVAALKFRQKFDKPTTVMGPDGKPVLVQISEDGTVRPMQGGYGVAEKLGFQSLGGKTVGLNPYTGQITTTLNHTQSPDSIAADVRASADRNGSDIAITPGAISNAAARYNLDGTLPPMGMGKTGAMGRTAILNEAAEQAKDISGTEQRLRQLGAKGEAQAKNASLRAYSAAGKEGQAIQAANTALNHLETVEQLAAAQKNGNIQKFNLIANRFAKETGNPAPTSLAAAITMVAPEVSKSVIGAAGGQEERAVFARNFDPNGSPAQTLAGIGAIKELMGGRLTEAERTYKRTVGKDDFRDNMLSPAAQRVIEKAQSHSERPAAPAKAEKFDMLPSANQYDGKRMRADNGAVYVSRGGKWVKE